ncbi:hypothetical protein SODALDRAFT_291665 [Sodiomyces alkalinus F11]|uniref:Mcm2 3 5 family protein n=1 Tax=Sodiomyces alkalinus (strain CBS 110278 / VKM F-3762 / F11) TaxID=1314773 RepID=A0A3N2Q308_SODAK|nr:hypothetical protein SODALDRAFT_291665 [Sodiomyces alkalinus F11]ROT41130.1 hypothetical protein SODALDRAFT_291665 [Sodiomyces alkalinus F11]
MPSDDAIDLADFHDSDGPSPSSPMIPQHTQHIQHTRSIPRVPVGSKASTPATPRSFQALMETPPDLSAASPPPPAYSASSSPRKSPASRFRAWLSGSRTPSADTDNTARPSYDDAQQSGLVSPGIVITGAADTTCEDVGLGNTDRSGHTLGPNFHTTTTTTQNIANQNGDRDDDDDDDDDDDKPLSTRYNEPPNYCSSKKDVYMSRASWLSISILVLSIYSTALSCLWFLVAIIQPRWGRAISTSGGMAPSTASVLTTLFAKTIEMSFVTVFISFLGQVLTRRSFIKGAGGMTLAEMTMRNWVLQPGSLITHWQTLPSAGLTFLGAVSLTATLAAMFYTTASEAMVTPKLKYGGWERKLLEGRVRSSYANPNFVNEACLSPLRQLDPMGELTAGGSCLDVQFSGQSYRNFMSFLAAWQDIQMTGVGREEHIKRRPVGTAILHDNTTMTSAWIDAEHADVAGLFDKYGRIINNVTLAMPHPGVYAAATDPVNGILQPQELSDVGEYTIKASVVSPAVNVMCVNMDEDELAPLVYTTWEDAEVERTGVDDQIIGHERWNEEVPVIAEDEWLNRTAVDDIFRWGPKYQRRPPVFQLYPADFNMLVNTSYVGPHAEWNQPSRDAIYVLAKPASMANYTLCEMRSWVSPYCSTHFNISGTAGAHLRAHCEDPDDVDSYVGAFPDVTWSIPNADWANLADQWRLSMDLNGGTYNVNASNARILSQLVLSHPSLNAALPSIAEALAVLSSSTLSIASLSTPFVHYWEHPFPILEAPGALQPFNASIRTQEYTSSHTFAWHNIFHVVLFLVFAINSFCLAYLLARSGLVTDFTEPQNLFALAVNSPPSGAVSGSCGAGPDSRALVAPWRVGFARSVNHYFFEEAGPRAVASGKRGGRGWGGKPANTSGYDEGGGDGGEAGGKGTGGKRSSFKTLSSSRSWL